MTPESPPCILSSQGPLTRKPLLPVFPPTSQAPGGLDGKTGLLRPSLGLPSDDESLLPTRTEASGFLEHGC